MNMITKTPTIGDVAREARVSTATVSRALSNPERVSEETRERVHAAIAATGYTLNQAARSLRQQSAKTILIALPNIGNPYYSVILDSVVTEAASRGYGVLVANRGRNDPTAWVRDYFFSSRADGLLAFDPSLDMAQLNRVLLQRGKLPIVVVCDEIIDPSIHLVTTDNRQASRAAVEHLTELGHTRIGHLSGRTIAPFPNERVEGYLEALSAHGLEARPEWLFVGDHSSESGEAAAHQFLALTERPTAIFCSNDEMAIALIAELGKHGVICPTDVSIVGFDDIAVARRYRPALTTVSQPRVEMGRIATATLLDIIEGKRSGMQPTRVILNSTLMVRDSTARVGSAKVELVESVSERNRDIESAS